MCLLSYAILSVIPICCFKIDLRAGLFALLKQLYVVRIAPLAAADFYKTVIVLRFILDYNGSLKNYRH